MKNAPPEIADILGRFSETAAVATDPQLERLATGLSGSQVWRLRGATGDWAVRCWPADFSPQQLLWIHGILRAIPKTIPVAVPLETRDGQLVVRLSNSLWSVEPWMPGKASFWADPSPKKLIAAMESLADYHQAARRWSTPLQFVPAVYDRIAALRQHASSLSTYRRALQRSSNELARPCQEILQIAAGELDSWQQKLAGQAEARTVLIPCLRDIWHDHVLFTGDQVTGWIDFGAMRMDSIATDLARLLGSLLGEDPPGWRLAIDAYRRAGHLPENDARLIPLIDESSQLIAGLNWIRWLFVENRTFDNPELVRDRLARILTRLQRGGTIVN